jgi:hypothetical protein
MLATHLGLPYWLNEAVTEATLVALKDPTGPLFSLIVVIIVGTTVHSLRETLDLPVAPPQNLNSRRYQPEHNHAESGPMRLFRRSFRLSPPDSRRGAESADNDFDRPRQPVRVPHHSELPEWEPPRDDPGLIQLEID